MSAYLPHRHRLRSSLAALDTAGLLVAGWLALALRFPSETQAAKLGELLARPGLLVWAVVSAWLLAIASEIFEPEVLHRRFEVLIRALVTVAAWAVLLVVAAYLRPGWAYGRGLLALTAAGWLAQMVATRWLFSSWLRQRAKFPALVVGEAAAVRRFCAELASRPSAPWLPVDASRLDHRHLQLEIERQAASLVVLAPGDEHALEMEASLSALHFSGVPVTAASEVWAWLEERLPLEALTPAFFLHQPGFGAVHWELFNRVTRILDVLLGTLLIVVAAPIFATAALLVLITDGRPVLYRQQRVGQFGRRFTMLKLRTMRVDAERDGPEFASLRDPRTTAIGRVLRRFRIDELPQLLNVVKGEMSLVGPRPERPEFIEQLSHQIPYYAFRLAVPPGLSGWAQVNTAYARDLEDHRRKLEFDLYFIRERSLRLYLLTLLRTISAALTGGRTGVVLERPEDLRRRVTSRDSAIVPASDAARSAKEAQAGG